MLVKHVKEARTNMIQYSNCLRCTGICGFVFLASLTIFQAAIVVPGFPNLTSDTSWVQSGNDQIDSVIKKVLQSDEAYYLGNETVLSNYQATIDDGQPPYNFIDYTDAQTSFHIFL